MGIGTENMMKTIEKLKIMTIEKKIVEILKTDEIPRKIVEKSE